MEPRHFAHPSRHYVLSRAMAGFRFQLRGGFLAEKEARIFEKQNIALTLLRPNSLLTGKNTGNLGGIREIIF
jgi:hypothetical protein